MEDMLPSRKTGSYPGRQAPFPEDRLPSRKTGSLTATQAHEDGARGGRPGPGDPGRVGERVLVFPKRERVAPGRFRWWETPGLNTGNKMLTVFRRCKPTRPVNGV